MYSTQNEVKKVVTERFTRTLNGKKSNKVTANESKYYLGYLNKLAGQYNKLSPFIGKTPIYAEYSAMTEEIKTNPKALKFKGSDRVRITKYKTFLVRATSNVSEEKYYLLIVF